MSGRRRQDLLAARIERERVRALIAQVLSGDYILHYFFINAKEK